MRRGPSRGVVFENQNEILIEKSDDAKRRNPRRKSFLKKKMKRFSLKKLISLSQITRPILNQAIEFEGESA